MNKSEPSRTKGLRETRRQGIDSSRPVSVKTTLFAEGQPLPLVFEPEGDRVDLVTWAEANRDALEAHRRSHGALLFRGFGVESISEFERFASVFCPELFGEYGDLPRDEVGGKVYASTPYPADQPILFHNESSHMHQWPRKIWFSCVIPSKTGGETPIVDCRKAYELLPGVIRERFQDRKLMYVRNYVEGLDVSWQSFFHTEERSVVERYCRDGGIDFTWKDRTGLETRQIAPAVVRHPETGELAFFNQIQLHHPAYLARDVRESLLALLGPADLPRNVLYGDGSPIEESVVDEIRDIYERLAVRFPWQAGDILMVDNMLVAHGRSAFSGPRKIVVAMGEMFRQEELAALR